MKFFKKKKNILLVGILLVAVILFILAYGKDVSTDIKMKSILSGVSIQNILENPSGNLERSLKITGELYQSGNALYIRDSEGYRIEVRECSKNRDLMLNEKITIKGYIFNIENPTIPVFYCGVFNDTDYYEIKNSLYEKLSREEQEKILAEEAKRQEAEREIEERRQEQIVAQQKLEDENRRQEIENDYKIKLSTIPSGSKRAQINAYDWLPALSECPSDMRGWTLGGCTGCEACIYEEVLESKYKVYLVIQYSYDGNTYRGNTISVSII